MPRRVLALATATAAAALLAAACSSGPQAASGPPPAGKLPPVAQPAPGATRPPGCSTAVAPGRALDDSATHLQPLPGSPFAVVARGGWAFAGVGAGVAVLRADGPRGWSLVRTIRLPGQGGRPVGLGEALTPDGRYLLVAGGSGASVLSVARAESGASHPILGALGDRYAAGGIEVTVSPDGRYAFVSMEGSAVIAVFRLQQALTSGFGPANLAGQIPTGLLPVGMAISPDGRWLYATSELASAHPRPRQATGQGTVQVMSLSRAETSPATAVLARVPAGCGPVRLAVSGSGQVIWVTARESDAVVAFSAARLRTDPGRALLAWQRVGEAPVGLALVGNGTRLVVADSNRFNAAGRQASLAVVSTAAVLAGRPALLGYLPAGQFPRDVFAPPGGQQVLVANYDSQRLETVWVPALP